MLGSWGRVMELREHGTYRGELGRRVHAVRVEAGLDEVHLIRAEEQLAGLAELFKGGQEACKLIGRARGRR